MVHDPQNIGSLTLVQSIIWFSRQGQFIICLPFKLSYVSHFDIDLLCVSPVGINLIDNDLLYVSHLIYHMSPFDINLLWG